jgi:hypothetical protein
VSSPVGTSPVISQNSVRPRHCVSTQAEGVTWCLPALFSYRQNRPGPISSGYQPTPRQGSISLSSHRDMSRTLQRGHVITYARYIYTLLFSRQKQHNNILTSTDYTNTHTQDLRLFRCELSRSLILSYSSLDSPTLPRHPYAPVSHYNLRS